MDKLRELVELWKKGPEGHGWCECWRYAANELEAALDAEQGGDQLGWQFDDGSEFYICGFAGGAHPEGAFSTVSCLLKNPDKTEMVLHYKLVDAPKQGWQPISTAPKDYEWFLGSSGGRAYPCRYDKDGAFVSNRSEWCWPTHWMPLPAPPEVKEADRG